MTLLKSFCWFKTFWNTSFSNFLIVKFKSVTASVILPSLYKLTQRLHNEDKITDAVTDLNFTIKKFEKLEFQNVLNQQNFLNNVSDASNGNKNLSNPSNFTESFP